MSEILQAVSALGQERVFFHVIVFSTGLMDLMYGLNVLRNNAH